MEFFHSVRKGMMKYIYSHTLFSLYPCDVCVLVYSACSQLFGAQSKYDCTECTANVSNVKNFSDHICRQ